MARKQTVEKVYRAIGSLRAQGRVHLTIKEVAEQANVARATINLRDDPDWEEVRAVIRGKPSHRVKLLEVDISKKNKEESRLDDLSARVRDAEKQLEDLRERARAIHKKLVDQVQHYFALSSETPRNQQEKAKLLHELTKAKEERRRLESELLAEKSVTAKRADVRPLASRHIIDLTRQKEPNDAYRVFLEEINLLLLKSTSNNPISETYILVGLPLSGKTSWIQRHQPRLQGTTLYIDGCNPELELRRRLIDHLWKISKTPIHCVLFLPNKKIGSLLSDRSIDGADTKKRIDDVAHTIDLPTVEENFSSIIIASR